MSKILVIVESPAKCKKIEDYLGKGYKVIASYGHFTNLNDLKQINFETYEIQYKIDKTKVLKSIKDEIKKSKEVIIATDDDREGEAIGWMLCVFCNLNIQTTKKITFQEITKNAIQNALQNIKKINMNRVQSQQARQILDIYLGYKVSPLLWKYIAHKLSAGRCQTPALKILYENQKEIDTLTMDTNYNVNARFTNKNIPFDLVQSIEKDKIKEFLKKMAEKSDWLINHVEQKQTTESPPTILITSTLQQKAHSILHYSPKATMKYAQELYENGFITYMRTDSACYSKDFIEKLKKHIKSEFGETYIHKNIDMLSKNKNKNKAQEAHEGIRVCDLSVKQSNSKIQTVNRLYQFIYKHTLQAGMESAINDEKHYYVNDGKYRFKYNDKINIFKGWKILENEKEVIHYRNYLDQLYKENSIIAFIQLNATEKLIKNILHLNEASLVQKLEKLNIGRPSTYSNIIQSVIDKKYANKCNIEGKEIEVENFNINKEKVIQTIKEKKTLNNEKNKLQITLLGKQVCEFCYEYFDNIFNYNFTNKMEDLLDKIEQGESQQKNVLDEYIQSLEVLIQKTKIVYKENPNKITKQDYSLHCGNYKNEVIYIKHGKYGFYLNIGKKEKISLNEFKGFNIEKKIMENEEITDSDYKMIIQYIKNKENNKNENICFHICEDCSIRKSKYGIYIFYKTKKMKKPQFLKFNDEKDDMNDERLTWIEEKNVNKIRDYINKKYKINI